MIVNELLSCLPIVKKFIEGSENQVSILKHFTDIDGLKRLKRTFEDVKGDRVLSVGSGPGAEFLLFSRVFPDKEYFGVDENDEFIELSRSLGDYYGIDNKYIWYLEEMEILGVESYFDTIMFLEVLEHVSDSFEGIKSFLNGWLEYVKTNGRVIITTPIAFGRRDRSKERVFHFSKEDLHKLFDNMVVDMELFVFDGWHVLIVDFIEKED